MLTLRREVELFLLALSWFTRVPVPRDLPWSPQHFAASARYYPLVGALVGLVGALVLAISADWLPLWPALLLSLAATVLMTGAFHEDGLADSADGLGGGSSPTRVLEIMKDSRIGSYGTLALLLVVLLKLSALAGLFELRPALASVALVAGHALSRLFPSWLLRLLPYARQAGGGKAPGTAPPPSRGALWFATACALLPLLGLNARGALAGLAASSLAALWLARVMQRRLGGYTGDLLGAVQQVSEVAFLLGLLAAERGLAAPPG
jgi:adenosylcobinamide-GDP ribazoletransferase